MLFCRFAGDHNKSKGMPRLICAPIKLIRKEIQVAIIEVLAQGSLGFSPLIREVGRRGVAGVGDSHRLPATERGELEAPTD